MAFKVLMVSSEIFPLAKTGGLADVVGALSATLAESGHEVAMVMPAYESVLQGARGLEETGIEVDVPLAEQRVAGKFLRAELGGRLPVYLLRADRYFLRPGLYGTPRADYPDNDERFVFFAKAVLELARRTGPWRVIHAHDWQSALVAVLARLYPDPGPPECRAKTVLTIHNLAYQGIFPYASWPLLGLDPRYFTPSYLEFYGNINFLKGGILFADAITTVSRRYAQEIKTPEYGCGLEGVIRERELDLCGILNGVDYSEWSPEEDPHIKAPYKPSDLSGKAVCKADLQASIGLPAESSVPLVGVVSRLVEQKGFDLLADIAGELASLDLQLVVLGAGTEKYEFLFRRLAAQHPRKVAARIGFDNTLAHKIEAGADLFLMPSKYEPCGLNQIYSLKYGTIPIVRATGGLDDTVEDYNPHRSTGNGFKFQAYSGPALLETLKRALAVYSHREVWERLVAAAMAADFSWKKSAAEYAALYRRLLSAPASIRRPFEGPQGRP